MSKSLQWTLEPASPSVGRLLRLSTALLLTQAGGWLSRVACRLQALEVKEPPQGEPVMEFYAESGAPEGALYVDGVRVGILEGVTRL